MVLLKCPIHFKSSAYQNPVDLVEEGVEVVEGGLVEVAEAVTAVDSVVVVVLAIKAAMGDLEQQCRRKWR